MVKDRSRDLEKRQPKTVEISQLEVAKVRAQSRNSLGIRVSILLGIGQEERRGQTSR